VDYYGNEANKPSQREQKAIFETNFNLYNLITLFLTGEELKEIGYLVSLPNDEFLSNAASASVNLVFCFYVIGAIGVGKSSVISFFRNTTTHDEWPDFRRPELGRRYKKLTPQQEQKVDNWINRQFRRKNAILSRATWGLHVIDRAPLDPITFKKRVKRGARASSLLENVCEAGAADAAERIREGHVILLEGDPAILQERAEASGKEYNAKDLQEMQEALARVYDFRTGVSVVDTRHKSKEEVAKEIAEIVHVREYNEADLHGRLANIASGRFKC
jgi:ribose 1,5-bisphosphokinase PhnN